jgi:hypothetical protein
MLFKMMLMSAVVASSVFKVAQPVAAHSWYPVSCCSDQDCEMVPAGAIRQESKGYRIEYVSSTFGPINEVVPASQARSSEDANFHACWRKANVSPRIICFFAPLNV